VAAPSNGRSRVGFGLFEADLSSGELYKSGHRVRLLDKPFRLLSMLLERPGEIVTREQVRKKLWPDGTFVDFDEGLDTAIKKLRNALDDSARNPSFIETIPRRGYRFIAPIASQGSPEPPVAGASTPVSSEAGSPTGQVAEARQSHWSVQKTVAGLGAVAGVSLLLFIFGTKHNHGNLEIIPLATPPGWVRHPSFSPDGNEITFDYTDEDSHNSDIYIQDLGDDKMLRLTTPPGASFCPSWSPDGQKIAYAHYLEPVSGNPERTIMLMTQLGGSKRIIRRLSPENGSCRVSWSPHGELLGYADKPPGETIGIFLMSTLNSDSWRLTTAPENTLEASPAFSPDGKQIAFLRVTTMSTGDIYVVSTSGGEPRRLTFLNDDVDDPIWTSDGRSIIFTVKGPASGGGSLHLVSLNGGEPERLTIPDSSVSSPTTSRSGDRLAYEKAIFSMTIWKLTIPDSSEHATKLIGSTRTDSDPAFSPDGKQIAFDSTRDGTEAIWLCNADGTNPIKLATVHQGGTPSWAPDGTQIAFDDRRSGRSHIYLINVHDGSIQRVSEGDFDDEVPRWSADGKWIYLASNRTGRYEIWKTSVPSEKKVVQITRNGGLFPSESPDGRFVYYNKPAIPYLDSEARGVWRMRLTGGAEELMIRDPDRLWQVRPEGIYFTDNSAKNDPVLKLFALETRTTKVVGHLNKEATNKGGHNLEISPDRHTALYGRVDAANGELVLVKGGSW
jgi:Tol biopolymer transport system component/DNA-binding winged helix-turn-helix (wHTH) protein